MPRYIFELWKFFGGSKSKLKPRKMARIFIHALKLGYFQRSSWEGHLM
jgi:hypothetical protein